jgi:predicted Zn finger-like uncharacterized protein
MTIECGSCGSRYNIQDSLIPPQGARVRCKKCATMISVSPPQVTELEAQDLELIPPTPEPSPEPPDAGDAMRGTSDSFAPERVSDEDTLERTPDSVPLDRPGSFASPPGSEPASSEFERSVVAEPSRSASARELDMPLERYPLEPPPEQESFGSDKTEDPVAETPSADEDFERAGAPAPYDPQPSFAEASSASPAYSQTLTAESPEPDRADVAAQSEPDTAEDSPQAAQAGFAGTPMAAAPAPAPAPAQAPSTSPAPTGTPLPQGLSPEERSAHEKARRLARVLASDIAIYNRDKKERGIREGNLVAMLGYEIKKSWEIYKERVGSEFANSTPYFRDALNEMLAEGKKIF